LGNAGVDEPFLFCHLILELLMQALNMVAVLLLELRSLHNRFVVHQLPSSPIRESAGVEHRHDIQTHSGPQASENDGKTPKYLQVSNLRENIRLENLALGHVALLLVQQLLYPGRTLKQKCTETQWHLRSNA
jgi:hypothetical protein